MKRILILIALLLSTNAFAQTDYWNGKSASQAKTFLSIGTADISNLSSWAGSTNITTLGTIATGVWQGSAIQNSYLANSAITIQGVSVSLGGTALATNSTPQFLRLGLNQAADGTASIAATQTGLATTSTDGVILQNTSASSGGTTQQYSPRIVLAGTGWNSSGSSSETDKFSIENQPQTVAGTTTTNLVFRASIAGGSYSTVATLKSGATLDLASGGAFSINGTSVLNGTTLGSGVTSSSLTTVGTIGTGTWQATQVGTQYGGTGLTSATTYAPLCGGTTSTGNLQYASTGMSNSGYVLTSNGSSSIPTWQAPSGGGYMTTTITADQSAAVGNSYVNNKASTRCVVTLPSSASVGQKIQVLGYASNGWKVAQNASQVIHWSANSTTSGTGGYLQSTQQYDNVELVCIVANTDWEVLTANGQITVN